MTRTPSADLGTARDLALAVRELYEVLENRLHGTTWSTDKLMIGFGNDVGHIGRLLLAHDGTWDIDGDVDVQLRHKLAESLWWTFVLADRLDIDLDAAFADTMTSIRDSLITTIERTAP